MTKLIKTQKEISAIRRSGKILADTLRELEKNVRPGVRTIELDELARKLIEESGGEPAFLGYKPDGAMHPFPYTLCASVNEVIVHGRPSDEKLNEGDIIKLDLGVNWNGGISDSAITVPVGRISKRAETLIDITKNALNMAIAKVKAGNTIGDISHAVEKSVENGGGKIILGLGGHGVGLDVHEDPFIPNVGEPGTGMELKEGMVLAIEPMTSLTTEEIIQLPDDSFVTDDGNISAQFEHTVLVTKNGAEVLTK